MFGKKCNHCGGKTSKTERRMTNPKGKVVKVTIYICRDCGFETTSSY